MFRINRSSFSIHHKITINTINYNIQILNEIYKYCLQHIQWHCGINAILEACVNSS